MRNNILKFSFVCSKNLGVVAADLLFKLVPVPSMSNFPWSNQNQLNYDRA